MIDYCSCFANKLTIHKIFERIDSSEKFFKHVLWIAENEMWYAKGVEVQILVSKVSLVAGAAEMSTAVGRARASGLQAVATIFVVDVAFLF